MRSFLRSFVYAFNGLRVGLKEERNLRFHFCMAMYVYAFSFFYNLGKTEYALITILVAGMIALELVNSSFERAVSRPSPERYVTAGVVKDMAAGAVLVFSFASFVCGVFLFWDISVLLSIGEFFLAHPLWLVLLFVSLIGSIWFVFYFEKKKPDKKKEKQS